MDLSFLVPGEVETRGSTQLVGKPLPQYKPSTSRLDAIFEEKVKIMTQNSVRELLARSPIKLITRH